MEKKKEMERKKAVLKPSYVLGLSITIYVVGTVLGGFAAMIVSSYMGNDVDSYFNFHTLIVSAIVIPVVYRLLDKGEMWRFRERSWPELVKYAALGMLMIYAINCIFEYVLFVFDLYEQESVKEMIRLNDIGNSSNMLLQILGSVLAASICEELFFRGVLFGVLRRKRSFLFSAVISSLIFGICHDFGVYMIIAFLVGLILCQMFELTQSIIVPIMIHACNNLLAAMTSSTDSFGSIYRFENMMMNVLMMLLLSAMITVVFIMLLKKVKKVQGNAC